MTDKLVSQLDANGYYFGPTWAQESPLEPGIWLIPAGAIEVDPPEEVLSGKRYWYADGAWQVEDIPAPPGPTPEQILSAQSAKLSSLKAEAEAQKTALTKRISVLQDAIDNVGVEGAEEFAATPEEQIEFPNRKAQLTKWKNYAIALGRVTTQAGWPPEVVWPAQPAEGMDLTVSSVAPNSPQLQ